MHTLSSATAALFEPISGLRDTDFLRIDLTQDGDEFIVTAYGHDTLNGKVCQPSFFPTQRFFARIPERKQLSDPLPKYQLGLTDFTASIIDAVWPHSQITFEDDAAKTAYQLRLLTLKQLDVNARRVAEYRIEKRVPEHRFDLHPEAPLVPYQQLALACASDTDGYGLFMEQGTGKTPIPIARICNEAKRVWEKEGRPYRAIIVAPKNVRMNWEREFAKFATEVGRVTVLRGAGVRRMNDLIDAFQIDPDDRYTVVICSYDALAQSWDGLQYIPWDLAVLDEAHYIKTSTTRRAKYALKLRDNSVARMVLTGTPITNSMMDLYSILEFLGKGYSGFSSFKAFKAFYGVYETTEQGFKALVGIQNAPFMQERLARMSFIIRTEEALPDLPEKVYDVVEVEMTDQQQKVYNRIVEQLEAEIDEIMNREVGQQLVINNVLTRLLRLAQVTSGFVVYPPEYDDDGNVLVPRRVEWMDTVPKLDALVELLKEKGPHEKTLVWACWREDLLLIHKRLEEEGLDHVLYYGDTRDEEREEAERRYNYDPNCRVFVGNPAAGGTGLNLLGYPLDGTAQSIETNTSQEVYYSQGWSPVQRSQSEARGVRKGTRVHVRITDLCVPQTIDEEIRARVMGKIAAALELSDLSAILKNVLRRVERAA